MVQDERGMVQDERGMVQDERGRDRVERGMSFDGLMTRTTLSDDF
jgi:hypothetical protein